MKNKEAEEKYQEIIKSLQILGTSGPPKERAVYQKLEESLRRYYENPMESRAISYQGPEDAKAAGGGDWRKTERTKHESVDERISAELDNARRENQPEWAMANLSRLGTPEATTAIELIKAAEGYLSLTIKRFAPDRSESDCPGEGAQSALKDIPLAMMFSSRKGNVRAWHNLHLKLIARKFFQAGVMAERAAADPFRKYAEGRLKMECKHKIKEYWERACEAGAEEERGFIARGERPCDARIAAIDAIREPFPKPQPDRKTCIRRYSKWRKANPSKLPPSSLR